MRKILIPMALLGTCMLAGASDWLMEGGNVARDGWVRSETTLNKGNVKDMKLLWKTHMASEPRQMHNIFNPLVVSGVKTTAGDKQIAVVAGITDDVFGLDSTTGKEVWHTHLDSPYVAPVVNGPGSTLCPGGQTAVPVITPGNTPGEYTMYTVSWDGRLWALNLADGKKVGEPQKFMPPNAKPQALGIYDGTIYTSTAQGCGGNNNGFYSFNLATRKVSMFLPAGGGLWGRRGVSLAPDGTAYMGTGDGGYYPENKQLGNATVAVKLDGNKQLQLAGYYGSPDANWLHGRDLDIDATPVPFDYKGRHFLVSTSKQCKVWLLDRDNLGGADHSTALDTTGLICNDNQMWDGEGVWGAMSAWQDASGQQFVSVPFWGAVSRSFHAPLEYGRPTEGGLAVFKVVEKNGKFSMVPAWLSGNMPRGDGAIYANGVVYAYGSGEDVDQRAPDIDYNDKTPQPKFDPTKPSAMRIAGSKRVMVYALDGQTGKQLWSSGTQIESFNHFVGLTVANGKVYVPTYTADLYCFGLPGSK